MPTKTKRRYTSSRRPEFKGHIVLTDRDFELFKLLARYVYLPRDYIQAFVPPGNTNHMQERLRALTAAGYLHRPEQQWLRPNALARKCIYQLGARGANALIDRGFPADPPRARGNFAHELMAAQIMASVELGARETGTRLITWKDIQASDNFRHAGAARSDKPRYMPVGDGAIAADGEPFGIEHNRHFTFTPGIEADCGTETVAPADLARSSIQRKFEAYLRILAHKAHVQHFGFPPNGFYVPFITTSTARMQNMMKLLERMTNGKGSPNIIFKTFPHFASYEKPPAPSGEMLTGQWQRVWATPFRFLTD